MEIEATEYLGLTKERLERHAVMRHPFLARFEQAEFTPDALRQFSIQWYKTARAHKLAFPALVLNTRNDDVRFDLIEILREEYGNGQREQIHARLLLRFLNRLGMSEEEVDRFEMLAPVLHFSDVVLKTWRDDDPVVAFGLHFALELLAARLHQSLATGLTRIGGFTRWEREYFEYHSVAEVRHADVSERGFLLYAVEEKNRPKLGSGLDLGANLLTNLYDGFLDRLSLAA